MSDLVYLLAFAALTVATYLLIAVTAQVRSSWRHRARVRRKHDRAVRCMFVIDKLRELEGWSVELVCDNPDFEGPGSIVGVYGEWCGKWYSRQFYGPDLLSALCAAYDAYRRNVDGPAERLPNG